MKRQIFKYMWEKPRDGCRYISARDIVHALGNSDQYPFPLGRRPKTPEEESVYQVMFETLDAVLAAIATAFLRYGILSLPSTIVRKRGSTMVLRTRTLIRAAAWSDLPLLYKTRKQTLKQISSIRSSNTRLKFRV